jgi:hypothetical protein
MVRRKCSGRGPIPVRVNCDLSRLSTPNANCAARGCAGEAEGIMHAVNKSGQAHVTAPDNALCKFFKFPCCWNQVIIGCIGTAPPHRDSRCVDGLHSNIWDPIRQLEINLFIYVSDKSYHVRPSVRLLQACPAVTLNLSYLILECVHI